MGESSCPSLLRTSPAIKLDGWKSFPSGPLLMWSSVPGSRSTLMDLTRVLPVSGRRPPPPESLFYSSPGHKLSLLTTRLEKDTNLRQLVVVVSHILTVVVESVFGNDSLPKGA